MQSRFLREIPEDIVEKKGGYYSGAYNAYRSQSTYTQPRQTTYTRPTTTPSIPIPEYRRGDMVQHKAFGRGMILSVLKMSGDALLEVAFDEIGTKKLMAKTASAYMKRL